MACLFVPSWAQQQSQQTPQQPQQTRPQSPQGQQTPPTISVNVKVVNVLATVRNKHGDMVRNLTKDDFVLEEDDRAQKIAYFSRESDLPLTLGLLVDTSMSQRRVLDQERSASSTFLDQVLRVDKDKAFLIHFDREVELLQDLTSSRQKLESALALLQTPQFGHESQEGGGNSPDSNPGGRTGGAAGAEALCSTMPSTWRRTS
jgi:VWFA-related protein